MVNEVDDIKRRAGISTNWDRDAVSRAIKRMEADLQEVFTQFTHMEGHERHRPKAIQQVREMRSNLTMLKSLMFHMLGK